MRTRNSLPRVRRLALATTLLISVVACGKDSPTSPDGLPASSPGTFAADAASAELTTADIPRFWAAYDEYLRTRSATAFQTLYLAQASPGFADLARSRSITAASLAQVVNTYPRYFEAARATSLSLVNGGIPAQIRAGYAVIKSLYPAAVFPNVTFAIGRFSTGGTTANNRILVGSEFYMANDGVPIDELGSFQRMNVKANTALPIIVAHEHVHVLQARAGGIFGHGTLLEQALTEGIADFIGEMASGGNVNAWQRPYALEHEHDLWTQFKAQMNGNDITQWLYNQGTATGDRPGDLGYFIGYRVAQSYYDRASNKTQAIKDIIEIRDAAAFVNASGYNP